MGHQVGVCLVADVPGVWVCAAWTAHAALDGSVISDLLVHYLMLR